MLTEIPADTASLRAKPRLKIFHPTEMRLRTDRVRVHLLDLSATGALVHCAAPPPLGTMVEIECGGTQRKARVVRSEGPKFGIQFFVALTDDELRATIAAADGRG